MTEPVLNDELVARYLSEHPDYFERHPALLAAIRVPNAHGGRAISLHERQLEVLREKLRVTERKLGELVHIGRDNETIVERMQHWVRELLRIDDPARLPGAVVDGLRTAFTVPLVALRLWRMPEGFEAPEWVRQVPADWIEQVDAMRQPYCGARGELRFAGWLPGGGVDAKSVAALPLRRGADPLSFGLLVLGSGDPERFSAAMGTDFLERIAELSSAALGRLLRAD